ncbi:dTMP kinase [Acidicapsa dinghuensis]|uniref:Thymidylate kinase n=1 Tax=Acidicapsa dinghuensis TaxID=2218256 RepID=A0ABW1EI76_9BACT|nr:dTMP kinase [Acidicapsa dinghuensis]
MAVDGLAGQKRGLFVTFEGLDGSGKTTQIRKLSAWLEQRGVEFVVTRQPGGTETGDRIRKLLLDSKSVGLAPRAELAMMFADRAQAIREVIEPALEAGKVVVCDRFTDSTEAYQGGGRELGSDLVLELHRLICGDLIPDLTLLLLPDLAASLKRARRRNDKHTAKTGTDESRFEREQDAFFERVHAKYEEIAVREPLRVIVVDGDLDIEAVHERVITAVSARLEAWQSQHKTSA